MQRHVLIAGASCQQETLTASVPRQKTSSSSAGTILSSSDAGAQNMDRTKKKSVSVWWPAAAQILRKLPHFKGAVQEDWSFELCF